VIRVFFIEISSLQSILENADVRVFPSRDPITSHKSIFLPQKPFFVFDLEPGVTDLSRIFDPSGPPVKEKEKKYASGSCAAA
jgi:hypothetical protein